MTRRLALAVGDTAGHVVPALALAEAFTRHGRDIDIRFFAAGEGAGHELVGRAGYPLHYLPGSQIARVGLLAQGAALARTAWGTICARRLLSRYRVRLVIGTGGFGSSSAVLGARSLGLRTALVEPNVVPGLANRLLGPLVDRVYIGYQETAAAFSPGRALLTGLPVRHGTASRTSVRPPPALPRLRIVVTSGSRGESFFAERVPSLAGSLQRHGLTIEVRHQGGHDADVVRRAYRSAGVTASVVPFIENMGDALTWADLAITRAGAGTLAELALAGIPALVVPLADAAHDHQAENAAAYAARGAAFWMREHEWDADHLSADLLSLLHDRRAWDAMAGAASACAVPDAAARIIADCESLMDGRW